MQRGLQIQCSPYVANWTGMTDSNMYKEECVRILLMTTFSM